MPAQRKHEVHLFLEYLRKREKLFVSSPKDYARIRMNIDYTGILSTSVAEVSFLLLYLYTLLMLYPLHLLTTFVGSDLEKPLNQ